MTYLAARERYDRMPYRRTGRSGLLLPAVSLGLWQNFGDVNDLDTQRQILRRAFDLGVTHFDLANNYGPPYGSAEENFGRSLGRRLPSLPRRAGDLDQGRLRHVAGTLRRPGSRKYLLASLDASLARMGLDYVDIFYSHRVDPDTPLEETMGALHTAVVSGRALYAGISSYSPERTAAARGDPRRPRHTAADPPAVVLDAQPVDRARPAGHAGHPGRRLHRVLAAGPGDADRPLSQRRAGGLAGGP